VQGVAEACRATGCALLGGETADLPDVYGAGDFDLVGFIVGAVERGAIIDGASIRKGDVLLGLPSTGLHTNGYSLARKIFFERLKLKPTSYVPELDNTIGDELLKVHVSYGPLVQKLLRKFNAQHSTSNIQRPVKAFAHITGGGFVDNIPRVLPKNCDVVIEKGSWDVPPIFRLIANKGRVQESEMYQVFNMGIGMVAIVAPGQAEAALKFIRARKQKAWLIGEVVRGRGRAKVQ
jgi:phosphoribosylformylglycinamidine cyclo-ligase